jgi:citrate synthase
MLIESTGGGAVAGSRWITTTEAAQRLGVKRATLYAYVSRGVLHSERRPGQQESLFDRTEIDALAGTTRASGSPRSVLRFRSVATAVSSQLDGDLLFRGIPLVEVVGWGSFGAAATLVLGGSEVVSAAHKDEIVDHDAVERLRPILTELPFERRLPVAMQVLPATDPFAVDTDPDRVRRLALTGVASALAAFSMEPTSSADVPELLLAGLRGSRPSRADTELMQILLVALLDHGLTASTIAARVAASTRAGLHDCLCAAYAAMAGRLHGAAPVAARALLDDPQPPARAVGAAFRAEGLVPGFGHFLYPDGDPRADVVFDALWRRPGTVRLRRTVERLSSVVSDHSGARPNIDLASAAALRVLGLPAQAGEIVFQVARSYGVTAHVIEEYAETPLRWRGRDAIG